MSTCCICGLDIEAFNANRPRGTAATCMVGHHGDGYHEEPWPVCSSCNAILRGFIFHMGLVSKADSRSIVAGNISSRLRHRIAAGEMVDPPACRPEPPVLTAVYQTRLDLAAGPIERVQYVDAWPPPAPPELPPPPAEFDGEPRWVGWFVVDNGQVVWLDQYLLTHDPATDPPSNPFLPVPPPPDDPPELPARADDKERVHNLHVL